MPKVPCRLEGYINNSGARGPVQWRRLEARESPRFSQLRSPCTLRRGSTTADNFVSCREMWHDAYIYMIPRKTVACICRINCPEMCCDAQLPLKIRRFLNVAKRTVIYILYRYILYEYVIPGVFDYPLNGSVMSDYRIYHLAHLAPLGIYVHNMPGTL